MDLKQDPFTEMTFEQEHFAKLGSRLKHDFQLFSAMRRVQISQARQRKIRDDASRFGKISRFGYRSGIAIISSVPRSQHRRSRDSKMRALLANSDAVEPAWQRLN